jgi:hypothetical protein
MGFGLLDFRSIPGRAGAGMLMKANFARRCYATSLRSSTISFKKLKYSFNPGYGGIDAQETGEHLSRDHVKVISRLQI